MQITASDICTCMVWLKLPYAYVLRQYYGYLTLEIRVKVKGQCVIRNVIIDKMGEDI